MAPQVFQSMLFHCTRSRQLPAASPCKASQNCKISADNLPYTRHGYHSSLLFLGECLFHCRILPLRRFACMWGTASLCLSLDFSLFAFSNRCERSRTASQVALSRGPSLVPASARLVLHEPFFVSHSLRQISPSLSLVPRWRATADSVSLRPSSSSSCRPRCSAICRPVPTWPR